MNRPANRRWVREWVEAFYLPMYRYAYFLSGSHNDAEDLTQEAFCKAQMSWKQLRQPDHPRPWLFAILRNCFLRQRRDEQSARQVPLDEALAQSVEDSSPLESSVAELQAALNELPEAYRTPIVLFYFDDFTYRDIADHMEIPIGTVMSRLARAKAYLRTRLEHLQESMR